MATTQTTRFKLPQWSQGTDGYPGRTGWNNILKLLEDQAAIAFPSGPISSRPASGTFGRFFLANDQGTSTAPASRLYYDGGSGWIELNTNGGGGPGSAIAIGGSASEGTSNRSARADHVHSFPLASTNTAGALSPQHYDLLAGAAVTATNGMLVKRTSSGNVVVPTTPGGPNDAASRTYVDNAAGTGVVEAVANSLMKRSASGTVHVKTGSHGDDATSISWVNSRINSHTHRGEDITSGYVHHERIYGSMLAWNRTGATTNTWATVAVDNSGRFFRYTSAAKYKTDIEVLDLTIDDVLYPEALEYTDIESGQRRIGFLADKLAGGPLDALVIYGEDGEVEGLHYELFTVIQQIALQHLAKQNKELNDRVHRIEGYLGL